MRAPKDELERMKNKLHNSNTIRYGNQKSMSVEEIIRAYFKRFDK